MKIPTLQGIIKRRILVNYQVSPEAIESILPRPFRPKLHRGRAIAGICLIRLERLRPKHAPGFIGISSENAAHRIAVEWDEPGGETREGVFIPRRDTNSLINRIAGGRIFPSQHHRADFRFAEDKGRIEFRMESADKETFVRLRGRVADRLPASSVFSSLEEASGFFERGSLGYSTNKTGRTLDGVRLRIDRWTVRPLEIDFVTSSFYRDEAIFPKGSVKFDHALLMENAEHEWHAEPDFEVE